MMTVELSQTKEKFFRSFQKEVKWSGRFSRFTLSSKREFRGKAKENSFFLYRCKKGVFPLFAATLYGKIEKEDGKDVLRCRVFRPPLFSLLLLPWSGLLLFTGAVLVSDEPFFSLCFFLPGILFLLFLFPFRGEKQALFQEVERLAKKKEV